MSLRSTTQAITKHCTKCCRPRAISPKDFIVRPRNISIAGPSTSRSKPQQRGWPLPLGLSLLLLPPLYYYLQTSKPALNPQSYTDHTVSSNTRITPQHALTTIPLSEESLLAFKASDQTGQVTINHVLVKNPDLMIERPYTPVNDVGKDGKIETVVKRVKGGEVGRMVHSLKEGDSIGLRGPVPTFALNPADYSRIIMISTGTAVAPFLQLLSKLPASAPLPQLHLIHSLPSQGREDWVMQPDLLPAIQRKFGDGLRMRRVDAGPVPKAVVEEALQGRDERILVLVCLPPSMLNPLCGPMSPSLGQGPVTGILRECGLNSSNVYKLE